MYCIFVLYCIVLYDIILYCVVLHCIALYCIVLYRIVLYCVVLYCIVLCCIVLYCIVLYCIVLYCIVLYCIVLYCSAGTFPSFSGDSDLISRTFQSSFAVIHHHSIVTSFSFCCPLPVEYAPDTYNNYNHINENKIWIKA